MSKSPFLGPAYQSRSPNLANDSAINIFAEVVEAPKGSSAEVGGFYSRPGLVLQHTVGMGPIRGMWTTEFGLFIVSGQQVYRINGPSTTLLGSIITAAGPVSIVANTTQVGIFDGVNGYAWSVATGFITLSLPFSNPLAATYQDGFVLVSQMGTFTVWQSNLNDLTTYNALNFSTEDGQPDNIVSLLDFHRQVVILKTEHLAFWINAGNPGFAFQRLDGVYVERGVVAQASPANCEEAIIWLGQGTEGQGVVYACRGYEAERISTYAIEYQIAQYPTMTDAIGFSYLQEGHSFYVLTFPTGNVTWVFDLTATKKLGVPMWYQWGGFAAGQINRWSPNCQASYLNQVLVGDYQNGNIYSLNMDALTDNGAIKKCLRSWRAAPENTYQTEKCNFLDLECDTGLQVDPNTNPQYVLRQSFDGSQGWSAEMYRPAGLTGETAQTVRWTRLGATRRGLNSTRIFELSTTDQFKVGWLGAEVG